MTPMTVDGEVNYEVLGEMLEAQIEGGTDAIIICGTTGESATLSERRAFRSNPLCDQEGQQTGFR